jgi:hypothetical protein
VDQIQVSAWSDGNGSFGFYIPLEYISKLQALESITLVLNYNDKNSFSIPNVNKNFKKGNQEIIDKEIKKYFELIGIVKNGKKEWKSTTPKFNFEFSRNSKTIIVTKV